MILVNPKKDPTALSCTAATEERASMVCAGAEKPFSLLHDNDNVVISFMF